MLRENIEDVSLHNDLWFATVMEELSHDANTAPSTGSSSGCSSVVASETKSHVPSTVHT